MRHLLLGSLLLTIFLLLDGAPRRSHHHERSLMPRRYHGRRIHRQIPHYPARNERSARYCSVREYHVICGPEKHCDKSCDNMYSPPNCYHDPNLPKCYFPRCLCKDGFVRDERGYCVWEHECPNRYMEPNGKNSTDDTMMMEFVPFVRPATAHRARKYRHSHHRHRRVQLTPSV